MNEWIEFRDNTTYVHIWELFKLFFKKIWLLLICALVFGALLFACSNYIITPLYTASIKMYVTNSVEANGNITSSDIVAAKNLVSTYSVVLKSRPTLDAVIEQTGVSYSNVELSNMISANSVNDTEIIRVSVTSEDPQEAAILANAIADVAPAKIMDVVTGSSVNIVENAIVPLEQSSPDPWKYTLAGAFFGLFIGCVFVIVSSVRKSGITVEERIRQSFNTAILSVIPQFDNGKLCDRLDFASAEAYKLLRTNLTFCLADHKKHRAIGVTSTFRGEGKTTTSINLAYSLAQLKKKVCLMDCDLRLPTVSEKLHKDPSPGLTNLLIGDASVNSILQSCKYDDAVFYIVPAGDIPPNPSELLESDGMKGVMESLANVFDYVILDLPPVGVVSDPLVISESVSGMVVVAGEDSYERKNLAATLRKLEDVKANILGIAVTHSTTQKKEYKKYGRKYGNKYGYYK